MNRDSEHIWGMKYMLCRRMSVGDSIEELGKDKPGQFLWRDRRATLDSKRDENSATHIVTLYGYCLLFKIIPQVVAPHRSSGKG